MVAARQPNQSRQESSATPSQDTASLSVPRGASRNRTKPEMAYSHLMPDPLFTATAPVNRHGAATPRMGSAAQQPVATPQQPMRPYEPWTRPQPSSHQQQSSYQPPYPSTQQPPPYDMPPTQRQPLPRHHPSSQGLLVSTHQPTDVEQIAALNLKLEAYRQIIVDLVKPVPTQQEPAVTAEQLKTSLRKAVSNPPPRSTATPYPDSSSYPGGLPYNQPPRPNSGGQSAPYPERFELPATNLQQPCPPPRIITTPPSVDNNPYTKSRSGLSPAPSNHHRTSSQPQLERPRWPATPVLSQAPARSQSSKEAPKSESPRQDCDSNGIPVPAGCYLLDSKKIKHGLELMAQYLRNNNADLTIIAVGGVVSAYFLEAWDTTTEVDALSTHLPVAQRRLLASAALYAKQRSHVTLGDGWFSGKDTGSVRPEVARDVYELSMHQNDIMFCAGGLTVVVPRWSYAFTMCVHRMSRGVGSLYDLGNAIFYLRRYIDTGKHKLIPIKGIMKWGDGYDLRVSDEVLRDVKEQYLRQYGKEVISE
ncbi:hypothetical protein V492_02518 [Pseudogymnoascus sp. VKM F-4246]|nr:hypothetical protein V492_02518 [Pseudogymnoascus sp. VKM F-4246]